MPNNGAEFERGRLPPWLARQRESVGATANSGISRREFLKLLAAVAFAPEFVVGDGDGVESPLRNWSVQTTGLFMATATPESPLSPKGSIITENPENFPRLQNEFVNWLVVDRHGSTVTAHRFMETHPEKMEAIRNKTSAFGFFVQGADGKNTLYPYVIGPTNINNPEKSPTGVFAWAGDKRLPAEYVQLETVVLSGNRVQQLLPGVKVPSRNELVVFGEPNPNQPGEILPHFYYFRDIDKGKDAPIYSLTFITPSGKDAVRISLPEGSVKLASLKEASPERVLDVEHGELPFSPIRYEGEWNLCAEKIERILSDHYGNNFRGTGFSHDPTLTITALGEEGPGRQFTIIDLMGSTYDGFFRLDYKGENQFINERVSVFRGRIDGRNVVKPVLPAHIVVGFGMVDYDIGSPFAGRGGAIDSSQLRTKIHPGDVIPNLALMAPGMFPEGTRGQFILEHDFDPKGSDGFATIGLIHIIAIPQQP